ncbi:MAG: hypothetical protein Q8Q49_04435, partial [bacterium]|nr:hypothetical protein [bacterium]
MRRMQVTVLIVILCVFGFLVWLTQKDSLSKTDLPPGLPGISPSSGLPPEQLSPIVLNQAGGNTQQQQSQQAEQQQPEQVVQG